MTAVADSSASIVVTWDRVFAIDLNGIITMYEVQYEPLDTFDGVIRTQTVNVSAVMIVTLQHLHEFVNYSISVRAYTSVGEGPYSSEVTARTQRDG